MANPFPAYLIPAPPVMPPPPRDPTGVSQVLRLRAAAFNLESGRLHQSLRQAAATIEEQAYALVAAKAEIYSLACTANQPLPDATLALIDHALAEAGYVPPTTKT